MRHRFVLSLQNAWYFVLAYYIAAVYVVKELVGRKFGKYRAERTKVLELPRRDSHVAVVTGGTRGIGLEVVRRLLAQGLTVIVGSSSPQEKRAALEESFRKEHPEAKVEIWHLDLASLKSVKLFADRFLQSGLPLNLLINNAGIMFVPYEETENGLERHFAVNYLSHCLLTHLLLPRLKETGRPDLCARIVNSASCIHFVGHIDFNDLQRKRCYSPYHAYTQSKLAQIMFTYSLQEYLQSLALPVTVNCVHPGVVNTDLMNSVWWTSYVGSLIFKSPAEGARTVLHAALSPDMEGIGGTYLEECTIVPSSKLSRSVESQRHLWEKTCEMLKSWLGDSMELKLPTAQQAQS